MSTPSQEPLPMDDAGQDQAGRRRSALRFYLMIAIFVWTIWLIFGGRYALQHLIADWRGALTMVFGSLV